MEPTGLTEQQVLDSRQKHGANELPTAKSDLWERLLDLLTEPMIILLLIGSGLYFFLGDTSDAIPLLFSVGVVIVMNIYEENKAERALTALKTLGSPKAYVIRYGETIKIPSREVVIGDHLLLSEGDRIAADGEILQATNLTVDEAMLTGESVTVPKVLAAKVYAGTIVTTGHGVAVVTKIGRETELGKIGASLEGIKMESSPAKREATKIATKLALIGLAACLFLLLFYGFKQGSWLQGLLAGITLAMSLIPEEIPVVVSVFTIMGAFRMSRHKVLAKRSSVIETLGAATVICLDKTGTITQNKMAVAKLYVGGKIWESDHSELPTEFEDLVKYALLASRKRTIDPMEKAIVVLGDRLWGTKTLFADWKHLGETPLSEKALAVSQIWEDQTKTQITATKGAPEAIIEMCPLNLFEKEVTTQAASAMAEEGLRVMGVAKNVGGSLVFLGLLGFSDPVRPVIKEALAQCYGSGVRVVIITGDHPETAKRVAAEIGLKHHLQYLTGSHLKSMDETAVREAVKTNNIFARITPSQKLLLIDALKQNGEIVAMVGDGINDAPAIKSAHIGIAMGEKGTDVAREASSLVLLDDNFTSVVEAIRQGRRIYDNIRKAISYVISMHFPIAGMALVPVALGFSPVLLPVHIALMEIFIDPACSIVFESQPEEAGIMKRPPRKIDESLINNKTVLLNIIFGLLAFGGVYLSFWLAAGQGLSSLQSRTATILTLLVMNIGLVLINRSWNKVQLKTVLFTDLPLVIFGVVAILVILIIPNIGPIRDFIKLGSLSWQNQGLAILIGVVTTLLLGGLKILPNQLKMR